MPTNVYLGQKHSLEPNLLVIRVNPMEGIYVKINAKKPGSESEIAPVAMDFCQSASWALTLLKRMSVSHDAPWRLHLLYALG